MQIREMYRWLWLVALSLCLGGCALGRYGKADTGYFSIGIPDGLNGQSRAEIIHRLGVPEYLLSEKDIEYWGYYNKGGWYLYMPNASVGVSQAKNLILEFRTGKATSCYLQDAGLSVGVSTPQGGMNN